MISVDTDEALAKRGERQAGCRVVQQHARPTVCANSSWWSLPRPIARASAWRSNHARTTVDSRADAQ